jgi:predicted permease
MTWHFWFRRKRWVEKLDAELRFHVEQQIQNYIQSGESPESARRKALLDFGGLDQVKEECREGRRFAFAETAWQDLRYAVRQMRHKPGFTITVILTLALGIGVNTAIFSLVDQVLLQTLPIPNPEKLVLLYQPGPVMGNVSSDEPGMPSFSYPMFRELQAAQTPFVGLAGARNQDSGVNVLIGGKAELGSARLVSGNYFQVLGVRPALGRLFTESDDTVPGGHPVVILSHSCWTSRFGNDQAVLNRAISLNGYPMTVVGVTQRGFRSEKQESAPDFYIPLSMKQAITPDWDGLKDRRFYWIELVGRLKPGITIEQATAEINVPYRQQLEKDIAAWPPVSADFLQQSRARKIVLKPGQFGRGSLREGALRPFSLLMALAGVVLLVCCANLANLQLARATTRTRETGVRLALGATRRRLLRQHLTESCAMAMAGGLLGLALGYWSLRAILALIPPSQTTPGFLVSTLDSRVLLFSGCATFVAVVLFGLFPALQGSKPVLAQALKEQIEHGTGSGVAKFFRQSMVAAQIAMSLVLLVTAGLLGRTFVNLLRIDLGLQTDHLLTFVLNPKLSQYDDTRTEQFYDQLTERLRSLPGVSLVSAGRVSVLSGSAAGSNVTVEGFQTQDPFGDESQSNLNAVGADYFGTMGVPLLAGREFTDADHRTAPKVAVVNEAFARHFLPNQNAVGRRMRVGGGSQSALDMEIVGVVKDATYSSMRDPTPRVFFTPYKQVERLGPLNYYLRTNVEPEQIAALVRNEVAALDPSLPVGELKTMEAQIEEQLFGERLISQLTTLFAGLATLLASIGLYGVLAYSVSKRTREIGIRMALGAQRGSILSLLLREGFRLATVGIAIGLATSYACTRFIESQLYGVSPRDVTTFVAMTFLFLVVALLACYIPGRRAASIDPAVALRTE